jgi:hypothetical protein
MGLLLVSMDSLVLQAVLRRKKGKRESLTRRKRDRTKRQGELLKRLRKL